MARIVKGFVLLHHDIVFGDGIRILATGNSDQHLLPHRCGILAPKSGARRVDEDNARGDKPRTFGIFPLDITNNADIEPAILRLALNNGLRDLPRCACRRIITVAAADRLWLACRNRDGFRSADATCKPCSESKKHWD
jgi:hypothetical protein